jgi:hypothetical protein
MHRKVILSNRSVYHKYTEIEIDIPDNIKTEDISEWIGSNSDTYADTLDHQLTNSPYEFGFGIDGSMDEKDSESETRYDIVVDSKIITGGHL